MQTLSRSLLILLLALSPLGAVADVCTTIWNGSLELDNVNAQVPLSEYQQHNFRTFRSVKQLLGLDYKLFLMGIKPTDLVIDSGAGLGIAGMQLSSEIGATVALINAQNVSHFIDDVIGVLQKAHPNARFMPMIGGIQNEKIQALLTAANGSGIDLSRGWGPLVSSLEALKSRVKLRYEIGYSEIVLPKFSGQAKMVQDVFGAYYYSSYRSELLQQYYQSLAPEGQAFIFFPPALKTDTVKLKRSRIALADYLTHYFPDVFSFSELSPNVLIIRRSPDRESLELGLTLAPEGLKYTHRTKNGYVVPRLSYQSRLH